ncbi:MAG: hypothetical protein WBG57_05810 [Ornithinimicrobium sp.]
MADETTAVAEESPDRHAAIRELIVVIVLSVTAVLTAWSGFESSKWGGEMSIAFSKASTQRIEASRQAASADAARAVDLEVFGIYLGAIAADEPDLERFAEERFSEHFDLAFQEWLEMRPLENPSAPDSPFALDSYIPPGSVEAAAADSRADAFFADALVFNQRGDNYTLVTVLFALVLFFAAFASRVRAMRSSWILTGAATVLLVVGTGFLLSFPKIL